MLTDITPLCILLSCGALSTRTVCRLSARWPRGSLIYRVFLYPLNLLFLGVIKQLAFCLE